ncbi:MAG: alpha/beta hydrolase [Thermosynechococcaceae cyanobacterium MS004]|nr:alpha/beta hydrolase [Thermosynechococcaceae cyanobacterium MS004]
MTSSRDPKVLLPPLPPQSAPILFTPEVATKGTTSAERSAPRPLFIFLPGMDGSGQLLNRQLEGLGRYFSIRCLSIPVDDSTAWADLAHSITALVKQELATQEAQAVYLCGESFGGCLALEIAAIAPQLVHRLILVNPASAFARLPWMGAASLLAPGLSPLLYDLSATALVPLLIAWNRVEPTDRQALLQAMQALSPKSAAWRLGLLQKFNLTTLPLTKITQPTLIIAGSQDRLLPSVSEAQRLVKLLPSAKMTVLPESGHACLLEKNVDLAKILQQQHFLYSPSHFPSHFPLHSPLHPHSQTKQPLSSPLSWIEA